MDRLDVITVIKYVFTAFFVIKPPQNTNATTIDDSNWATEWIKEWMITADTWMTFGEEWMVSNTRVVNI